LVGKKTSDSKEKHLDFLVRGVFFVFLRKKSMKLFRTVGKEAMLLGICGGLSKYFQLDATLVRVAVALLTFFSFFSLIFVYLIMAFIVPKEEITNL
jgi:phage shock protein C